MGAGPRGARQLARAALQRGGHRLRRQLRRGVEFAGPPAHRRRDGAAGRAPRHRGPGARYRGRAGACARRARRAVGQLAGARRAVARLARLPPGRGPQRDGLGAGHRHRDRQRALPAARRPGARRRGVLAGRARDRPRADRRRPGGQRARRLRGVSAAPEVGRGPVAPAAQGTRGGLVGGYGRVGACLPRPARPAAGHPRPHRDPVALHPDRDAVARRFAGGLQHHDRRVHRGRPSGAAALAVPGAGRPAGERGGRRGGRTRLRAAARPGGSRALGRHGAAPVDAGEPRLHLVRPVLGGADPRRGRGARRVGRRGRRADPGRIRHAGARPGGRTGARRGHGHLQQRRATPLRPPRCRLQPAGCADRARRARPERLHRGRPGRGRPGVHRGAQPAAVRDRPGQGVGAGGGAAGGGVGARR